LVSDRPPREGCGRQVLAEALHEKSARARKPFVAFDCTAVPPNLLESALFGHEKGSFTGATETRRGVFEEADGGTLLIDEIGDQCDPPDAFDDKGHKKWKRERF
jgi:DNA-binding NtrC family response regulator